MADPWQVSWGETTLRLGIGALAGGAVGIERELKGQPAGFRTHMLLALGSALFGVISVGGFAGFVVLRSRTDFSLDPTRIASYVAAGVGFLGAGAIVKSGNGIHGLTTAASLWTVAAVGLAAGLGFWPGAIVATGFAIIALLVGRPLDAWRERSDRAAGRSPPKPPPNPD